MLQSSFSVLQLHGLQIGNPDSSQNPKQKTHTNCAKTCDKENSKTHNDPGDKDKISPKLAPVSTLPSTLKAQATDIQEIKTAYENTTKESIVKETVIKEKSTTTEVKKSANSKASKDTPVTSKDSTKERKNSKSHKKLGESASQTTEATVGNKRSASEDKVSDDTNHVKKKKTKTSKSSEPPPVTADG